MTRPLRVLHLEDHPGDAAVIRDRLEFEGVTCEIRLTDCQSAFELALAESTFDLILADYHLPGYDGMAALSHALTTHPDVPVILVSGTVSEEEAVKCLQFGATDYLMKGRLDRLGPAVLRAIEEAQVRLTRKQAELALVQSEARKAAILDSVLDCIITMDADGVVIEFNAAAERTFGYTKKQAIGRLLADLIIPESSRQLHTHALARYLTTGVGPMLGKVTEMTARRADGSELPIELAITATPSSQAPIFTGVLRDITSRKRAEAAVREERDRAQRYLDTADVTLLALDTEGRITLINRKGCNLLGWTECELIGQNFLTKCLPERSRIALTRKFETVLEGDLSVVEAAVLTKSGAERLVEWRNTLTTDDTGTVTGTFSSGTDITERSQAITALQTAEERMRFALQAANVGIWDRDYATGVVRWSEILESQYGLARGAYDGTFETFIERIHPDDRQLVLDNIGKAMQTGADFSFVHRTNSPDGAVHWLSGSGRVLLGTDGRPVRATGISQDVTTRHKLEQQYQQAQKMEAIGQLAGGVAHDFNNLLTVILGYCEIMIEDLEPDDPCHGGLVQIQKAGLGAAGLTRQLLAFSRKEIISPTLLDLNVVLANMRVMLRRLIREDVKIELITRPEMALVMADRGQVEQIVLNLSVNARDAMPKGGTLKIAVATVELDDQYAQAHVGVQPGPYVMIMVTDTGEGIPPEVQPRLFEPFFTTKEPGRGTGLGLATVHGIVTQNGGSIEVSSVVGAGTTFRLYFPRAQAPAGSFEVTAPVVRASRGGETIVVVEDEEGLRLLITRLLERLGYTVLVAANAAQAIALFGEHSSIDLLLTDVVMPGGSGPDLSTWLVKGRPQLKVLYMSGYTDEAIVQHGVLAPGIAFLHKPFTAQELGLKVREVLDD
jgi:two-component system cell cycle sensor histidine kinase/response regulator CckA